MSIYYDAAVLVHNRENVYPCTAVHSLDGMDWRDKNSATRKFIITMAPGREAFEHAQNASAAYIRHTVGRLRSHSVTALLFMDAMETE